MAESYRSRASVEDVASEALVVSCSDRRIQDVVREFLTEHLGLAKWDAVVVPGGAYVLGSPFAGPSGPEMAAFLMDLSKPPRIVLLSHEGCGLYQSLSGAETPLPGTLKRQQVTDLSSAASMLRQAHANATVEAYFIARTDDGPAEFEPVA